MSRSFWTPALVFLLANHYVCTRKQLNGLMKDLYFKNSQGQTFGPISLDEIPLHPITPETIVWRPGMQDWVKAASIPDVMNYVPPTNNDNTSSIPPSVVPEVARPNNYMGWSLIAVVLSLCASFIMLPFGIVALIYSFLVDNKWNNGCYKEAIEYSRKSYNWSAIAIYGTFIIFAVTILTSIFLMYILKIKIVDL